MNLIKKAAMAACVFNLFFSASQAIAQAVTKEHKSCGEKFVDGVCMGFLQSMGEHLIRLGKSDIGNEQIQRAERLRSKNGKSNVVIDQGISAGKVYAQQYTEAKSREEAEKNTGIAVCFLEGEGIRYREDAVKLVAQQEAEWDRLNPKLTKGCQAEALERQRDKALGR